MISPRECRLAPIALLLLVLAFTGHAMHFGDNPTSGVLTVCDGATEVLSYCYADQLLPGVDPKYTRSCYIHPLRSLDGQVLTDDFPRDHPHHRGVFWTWPAVKVRGQSTQTWHPHTPPLRQHFVRWLRREATSHTALLSAESEWRLDSRGVVARERATVRVHPATDDSRAIDVELVLEAVGGPLTLQGQPEGGKGYGGFCVRAAPVLGNARLTTDNGPQERDVVNTPHHWADLSTGTCGLAVFVPRGHPGFPPPWLARKSYAGFLNPEWPGLSPATLDPGKPVTLRYRILVHRGATNASALDKAYREWAGR